MAFRLTSVLLLFVMIASPARAADPDALIAATDALTVRLNGLGAKDSPPMLTNDGADLVRTAYDENVLRAFPLDLDRVSRACIGVGSSIVAYVDFANRSASGARDPAAAADATLGQLQNELTAGAVAANLCVQKGFRAVAGFVAGLKPEQRVKLGDALAQMRGGATQTISSSIATAAAPNISLANRSKLLAVVIEDLRFTAASFPAAERRSLREQIVAGTPGLPPPLAKQARDIAGVLAGSECNLLCELGGS
jgi:hypothetical protein